MKKINKSVMGVITLVMLATIMMACSKDAVEPVDNKPIVEQAVVDEPKNNELQVDVVLEGPYIVTSCGQSPGAVMVNMIATQGGLTSSNDNNLTSANLDASNYKTLIVTTGTSMKGMGAAGTDVNAEIKRCVDLIKAAKEAGLTVVGAHVEGMARRTDSSDTDSINAIMELSDIILVVEESDSDGFFTKYAENNNKQLIKVKDALEIGTILN